MLENTHGVPLLLKGGPWQVQTDVEREEQYGTRWCWAACVAMVLKAFKKNDEDQCTIAKAVCTTPCDLNDDVMPGCDVGYEVNKIEALWETHGVPADYLASPVGWGVIEKQIGKNRWPVEIFLGFGNADSIDGHLVLIMGAETTAAGKHLVLIADPKSTNNGSSPTDFELLGSELEYGTWSGTWINLFWEEP